ncbi:hypothetical protein [Methanomethylophilus alvi]|uniref:hypothetical protein n=1 Tax=Methanomethylophilus alvi TaxID=1291540 RepID=UPI0037DD7214
MGSDTLRAMRHLASAPPLRTPSIYSRKYANTMTCAATPAFDRDPPSPNTNTMAAMTTDTAPMTTSCLASPAVKQRAAHNIPSRLAANSQRRPSEHTQYMKNNTGPDTARICQWRSETSLFEISLRDADSMTRSTMIMSTNTTASVKLHQPLVIMPLCNNK